MKNQAFLAEKMANNDLIIITVVGAPAPQTLRAKVQKIYSTGKAIKESDFGTEIDFVHASSSYGNTALKVGETALIFISPVHEKLYEDSWHGHMVIEEVEGTPHAIFRRKELWLDNNIPSEIRAHSRQDPKRPYATAINFSALENYILNSLIKKTTTGILSKYLASLFHRQQ